MTKNKKSYFVLFSILSLLMIIFGLFSQNELIADAATKTSLFNVKYSYTHYYSLNGVESVDGSNSDVLSSNTSSGKSTKSTLSFQMYGDSYLEEETLLNGGYINSSNVHIIANYTWPNGELILTNSSGTQIATGTNGISTTLSNGIYYVSFSSVGTGWLETSKEYAFYKIVATFSFNVDTNKPIITGASKDTLYTNKNVEVSASDTESGIKSFFIKTPSSSSYSISNYPYVISSTSSQNGLYSFYSVDNAGNTSDEYFVYLDIVKPTLLFKVNGANVSSYYVNKMVTLSHSDNDEVKSIYIKENDGEYFLYTSSYSFKENTKISAYCIDRAGNNSDVKEVYIDLKKPVAKLYKANGEEIISSLISSKDGFYFYSTDNESGLKSMFYKKDSDSSFKEYLGSTILIDGTYSFYSIDNALNQSETVTIALDNTSPATLLYENENVLKSSYTALSYVKFYANDDNNIKEAYYLINGQRHEYTLLSQIKDEGEYTFYAVDMAGNVSSGDKVIIDRKKPSLYLYVDGKKKYGGTFNPSSLYLTAEDTLSKVNRIEYSKNYGDYKTYVENEVLDEGMYSFYAFDNAGNKSSEIFFVIDKTNPLIWAINEKNEKITSKYFSGQVYIEGEDNYGLSGTYYKEKNDLNYTYYNYGQSLNDGEYLFYVQDMAGNKSNVLSLIKDTTPPKVSIFSLDVEILSDSITSKPIKFNVTDNNSFSCYVLLPGEKTYSSYNVGNILQSEGEYLFYAEDEANNKSTIVKVTIDITAPTLKLFINEEEKDFGKAYNNSFKVLAYDLDVATIYYKEKGDEIYSKYNGSNINSEGEYTFYAVDSVLNKSSEEKVILDLSSPVGCIYVEYIKALSLYTNLSFITYEAEDVMSNVENMYVKIDGNKQKYFGEKIYLDGEYIFYSIDEAGNISSEEKIIIDREIPEGEIIYNSTYKNCNVPFIYKSYDNKEISKDYIKSPSSSYSIYDGSLIEDLENGYYSFYSIDMAGNVSNEYSVLVDTIKPINKLIVDNKEYTKYYTNKDFYLDVEDGTTGYILRPNESEYVVYNEEIISLNSINGEYSFYSIDEAGNISEVIKVYLDSIKPEGIIFAGDKEVDNNTFTSLSVSFKGIKHGSDIYYIKYSYDGIETEYKGEVLSKDGLYSFYLVDIANNVSDKYIVTIDKVKPIITLYSDGEKIEKSHVNFDRIYAISEDENLDTVYVLLPNNDSYILYNNSTIYSLEGEYKFYSIDKANNKSDIKTLIVDRVKKEVQINSLIDGIAFNNVTISWKNTGLSKIENVFINDVPYLMNETIYILEGGEYKVKSIDEAGNIFETSFIANTSIFEKANSYEYYEVYGLDNKYHSFKTLDKAKDYVKDLSLDIKHYFYFEKEPSNNIKDDLYILSSIKINKNFTYFIDGELYYGNEFVLEGEHDVTILDKFNNSLIKKVIISNTAPTIFNSFDGDSYNEILDTESYFNQDVKVKVNGIDPYETLVIKNENGEKIAFLKNNNEYTLSSGKYYIQGYNYYNKSLVKTINISTSKAAIYFNELNDNKKLEISIEKSIDKDSKITSISIYKFVDNEYIKLTYDDYKNLITKGQTKYYFRTSNIYRVEVEDNFRFSDEKVSKEFKFLKANPNIEITNIDNYYTNQNVEVKYEDEAFVELYKNGEKIEFLKGTIKEEGSYILYFKDYDKYEEIYSFEIDKTKPKIIIEGGKENEISNQNIRLKCSETLLYLNVFKNNEKYPYEEGDLIKEDGMYKFIASDLALNEVEGTFEIDKKVNVEINTLDGAISSSDVVINNLEDLSISLTLNGEKEDYSFGDRLYKEGSYKATILDSAGNSKDIDFYIQKSKLKSFELSLKNTLQVVSIKKDEVNESMPCYVFNKDGEYVITLTDGEGFASFKIIIDTTSPIVEFDGVLNGGKTTSKVKIKSISEECDIKAYFNGYLITPPIDHTFSDIGVYTIYFIDSVGNESQYGFEIVTSVNKSLIFLILLILILLIILIIFIFIFKKKNKSIKELKLKKDEINKDEEKHLVEENKIEIVKEDNVIEKKEIEDRDIAISLLKEDVVLKKHIEDFFNKDKKEMDEVKEETIDEDYIKEDEYFEEDEKTKKENDFLKRQYFANFKRKFQSKSLDEKTKFRMNSFLEVEDRGLIGQKEFKEIKNG